MSEVVDLFAGPGGWDVAATVLGIDVVGLETDEAACLTRRAAGLCTIRGDVAAMDPLDFMGAEGLIASPPCQAWSRAGKRLGLVDQEHVFAAAQALAMGVDIRERLLPRLQDERSLLAIEPLRWALALQPKWVALEQVPDVLPLWQMIAGALGARGYSTWAGKLNAADYGVPQTRERAFMIASCERRVDRPPPTHADPRPGLPLHALPWVSMAEALGWNDGDLVGFPRRADTPSNKTRRGRRDRVEIDGTDYRARDLRDGDQPAQALTEKTRSWVVLRNGNQPRAAERRMDEPAPTMAFGNNAARVRFEVRTGQRSSKRQLEDGVYSDVESQPYVRDGDRPAPTVDSKPHRWQVDRVELRRGGDRIEEGVDPNEEPSPTVMSRVDRWQGRPRYVVDTGNTRSGDRPAGRKRPTTDPAPAVTSRADQLEWREDEPDTRTRRQRERDGDPPIRTGLRAGTNANDIERPVDQPAPTLRFGERLNTVAWTTDRPATTVSGDPRIAQPGHKRDEQNPDSPGRIEVAIVQKGDIATETIGAARGEGNRFASVPFYIRNEDGGREATLRRQCTREYKLEPIHRELRERGIRPAEMWLGISLDEIVRMKPSRVKWCTNVWPLIDAGLTRQDCERWFAERYPGRELAKSACVFCPFHTDNNWRDLRDNDPEGWQRAVEFDAATRRLPRIRGEAFVHRQMVPLDEVDLSTPEDRGQLALGFDDECEGMCGV